MYKTTISYDDFLGNPRVKEATFHLSESELLQFEAETDHGLRKMITIILEDHDDLDITRFMLAFVKASYGEISPDGSIFDKSDDVWNRFYRSPAFDKFFMKVMTDGDEAVEFINKTIEKIQNERS